MVGAGVEAVEGIGGILHLFPFQKTLARVLGRSKGEEHYVRIVRSRAEGEAQSAPGGRG
jgi:hypothetical protein